MKLWLVGEHQGVLKDGEYPKDYVGASDLVGVFDSEDKAIEACYNEMCFIGPVEMNMSFGEERVAWIGSYYPKHPCGGKETAVKEEAER